MRKIITLALFIISTIATVKLSAQLACQYRLDLYDSFGDGWNGASLTVVIDGVPTMYTLNNISDDGIFYSFTFPITTGASLSLDYSPGSYENEVSYFLYDADGVLLYNDGPYPNIGQQVFATTALCPTCPAPSMAAVSIDDVRAFYADISWVPSDPNGVNIFEFGPTGFTPGTGSIKVASGAHTRLNGLQENTDYEFFMTTACSNGDTSITIGPYHFHTLWANDVGVTDVFSPITGCGLSAGDTIRLHIFNFGGNPQSLIPFNYSVNGVPANVNQPIDGFYTGVLGKDSTAEVEFKLTVDLSEPGDYLIAVWTDLDGDSDHSNDTTYITITNIPIISNYPYFTNYETGSVGWTVGPESVNSTWEFGVPMGTMISAAASGVNAWVTNLDGTYNNNELSYLVSPCLDFSSLSEDPQLNFSLFYDGEACCDEAWVEVTTDGGNVWNKVGTSGTGVNWYNDSGNQWWDGTGGFTGWVTAANTLAGTAGESDVRLRFVFSTDVSVVREGMGVDNVFISQPLANDLSAISVNNANAACGDPNDLVTIRIFNNGTLAQTGFEVGYQVNSGAIIIENVGTLSVNPGQQANYTFNTPFNSSSPGVYQIVTWTNLAGELFLLNDTITTTFASARAVPFSENFEAAVLPSGWNIDSDITVTNAHSNLSYVLSDNLWSSDQIFNAATPAIGPIAAGDSLLFDYRMVNFSGNGTTATPISGADTLFVDISTNCGQSYTNIFRIDSTNHVVSNVMRRITLPLDNYSGQAIKIRFRADWGAGDYYLDLDNINVKRCPASLELQALITNATHPDSTDGKVTIATGTGIGPFTFNWSNGQTGGILSDVGPGSYTVSVTDAVGCSDVIDFEVGVTVGTQEATDQIRKIQLAPNPTTGLVQLSIAFNQAVDARIQVVNLLGQPVFRAQEQHVSVVQYPLDLSTYADGFYLVQVAVGNEVKVEKLVKVSR